MGKLILKPSRSLTAEEKRFVEHKRQAALSRLHHYAIDHQQK